MPQRAGDRGLTRPTRCGGPSVLAGSGGVLGSDHAAQRGACGGEVVLGVLQPLFQRGLVTARLIAFSCQLLHQCGQFVDPGDEPGVGELVGLVPEAALQCRLEGVALAAQRAVLCSAVLQVGQQTGKRCCMASLLVSWGWTAWQARAWSMCSRTPVA